MTDNIDHLKQVQAIYSRRAASYDASNDGWHAELAQDFVNWLDVKPGEIAIDLACGTGLVTVPLAAAVGPSGTVIGVDMTTKMLDLGRARLQAAQESGLAQSLAPIEWIEQDITSVKLLEQPAIKAVVEKYGGFDIISVCSALLLLPDPAAAVQLWAANLLRKGGRMIIDVTTEDMTLNLLIPTYFPHVIGLSSKFADARKWIKDKTSLASLFESVGLRVEQNFRTRSYLEEKWYPDDKETSQQVMELQIKKSPAIEQLGKDDEVRKAWPEVWPKVLRKGPDGKLGISSGYWLYVCVGSKP